MNKIENDSVSLILTDPPDTISHKTEIDKPYNDMKENEENDADFSTADEECHKYRITIGDEKKILRKKEQFMEKIWCGN